MKRLTKFDIHLGPPSTFIKTYDDGSVERVITNNAEEYAAAEEACIEELRRKPSRH